MKLIIFPKSDTKSLHIQLHCLVEHEVSVLGKGVFKMKIRINSHCTFLLISICSPCLSDYTPLYISLTTMFY